MYTVNKLDGMNVHTAPMIAIEQATNDHTSTRPRLIEPLKKRGRVEGVETAAASAGKLRLKIGN